MLTGKQVNKLLKQNQGSALIISVAITAVLITASLSVSLSMSAATRNTAYLSHSNKAYFSAEAGIESAIYALTGHGPGYEVSIPELTFPASEASAETVIDNRIQVDEGESFTIVLAENSSVAVPLYYEEGASLSKIDLEDLGFELSIEDYTGDLLSDLEPDYFVNEEEEF